MAIRMESIQNSYLYFSSFARHAFLKLLFLMTAFFLALPTNAVAIVNPLEVPNNKYGIHVVNEGDLESAASLVNSSNGDWGYVTMVITENDREVEKWQEIFDAIFRFHLIPIIRLATKSEGDYWKKPELSESFSWGNFLSRLSWVTKNRYVVLFNEPNHAKEWGGSISPQEYAEVVSSYSATLKKYSPDFFILPAGFDASAPNSSSTMDEARFLKQMVTAKPDIFSHIDGWTSHSYPNPGFIGNINARGRGTLTTYQWELDLLKKLGNTKKLPVFITETGWPHKEGRQPNHNFFTADQVASLIAKASETVWDDDVIVSVNPFILNYQSHPFSHFSWQKIGEDGFYSQYDAYRSIPKIAGVPLFDPSRNLLTKSQILGIESSNDEYTSLLKVPIKKRRSLAFLIFKPFLQFLKTIQVYL